MKTHCVWFLQWTHQSRQVIDLQAEHWTGTAMLLLVIKTSLGFYVQSVKGFSLVLKQQLIIQK